MERRATYLGRKTRQPFLKSCMGKLPSRSIWRPVIPSWEKEFTSKVGSFQWETFIEAKKMIFPSDKIMQWNDSASEEDFYAAKQRFWEEYNRLPSTVRLANPDMYIDKIDWNSEPDLTLLSDIEKSADEMPMNCQTFCYKPKAEVIKPTGWDADIEETADLLTGLIVGENVLQDGVPTLRNFRQIV